MELLGDLPCAETLADEVQHLELAIGERVERGLLRILGSVADPDDVAALSYRVDGGPARPLTLGPDNRRLQNAGDFNVDIPRSSLSTGQHTVVITASYDNGHQATANVAISVANPGVLSLPRTCATRTDGTKSRCSCANDMTFRCAP